MMWRRPILIALTLTLAACAGTAPPPAPSVVPPPPPPEIRSRDPDTAPLIGMSEAEVERRFGPALLTIREGPVTKKQWRHGANGCVLDLFIADERVHHAEARDRDARAVPIQPCAQQLILSR